MKTLAIERFAYTPEGTFGRMTINGYTLYTVEQPWNGNLVGASCIPQGVYECVPSYYHRGGYKAVEVTGVAGRSQIKIHKANWPHQLRGCIAPVSDFGCVSDMVGGSNSSRAFKMFMEEYGSERFTLRITQYVESPV